MVSDRHTPGREYTEEDYGSYDLYDYMQEARKEKEKTDSIVGSIVVFIVVVVVSFSLGHLIGSFTMQEDFKEEICRDMPTTEEYFQCRSSIDINKEYKLIKR